MTQAILEIKDLQVKYQTQGRETLGVHQVNLRQAPGQNIGIIGESGSGKTSLGLAIMGLIEAPHQVQGQIFYKGRDLLKLSKSQLRDLRWKEIAMVFQNSLDLLNPVMTVGDQVTERLVEEMGYSREEARKDQERLLDLVALDPQWRKAYPHQLSGGMRQRVLIAMAISCQPDLIIFDEPTSALDVLLQEDMVALIRDLQAQMGFSMLTISHDLSVIRALSEDIVVMYGGDIVEKGKTQEVIQEPAHPYTRGLISSSVQVFPYKDLWGIAGEPGDPMKEACPFAPRCTQAQALCFKERPRLEDLGPCRQVACHRGGIVHLLEAQGLAKAYDLGGKRVQALKDAGFYIRHGETLALVGPSGSGKSTLAHLVAGFVPPDEGQVYFEGRPLRGAQVAQREGGMQLVLQDPFSSISRRLRVEEAVQEPLRVNGIGSPKERRARVQEALRAVQLPQGEAFLNRFCASLSGGQRQRLALARALVMAPKLLIADEITSMLDVSTQANIMRLLKGLQNSQGFAMIYITHNIHLARKISERIVVLKEGRIEEAGSTSQIMENTQSCMAQDLLESGLRLL
ncbi:MAG: ABC transporter ATP-binding protein [Tissierellia bacterium]|nr:ABC transporter ATP-binding protein [Tissierellia bacterium]